MTDYVISMEKLRGIVPESIRAFDTEIYARPLSEAIAEQRHGCLTCFDPTCPVWQAADQNCWKSEKEALKCQTCGGIVTHPMCDNCYENNIENTLQEALKAERERVLDSVIQLINKNCFELEGTRLKITPLLLMKEIESLRSEP